MAPHSFSVLLIDDDDTTANIFSMVLDHHDVGLTRFRDGATALSYLQENTPDAIVIDIFIPGLDGYQTLDAIRRQRLADGVPCVATTAYYNSDTSASLAAHGFDGYLPKPLQSTEIVPYLEQTIQESRHRS
jgi:CheY-like chemotaxis protein